MKIILANFMRLNSKRLPKKLLRVVGDYSLAETSLRLLKSYQLVDPSVDVCAFVHSMDQPLVELAQKLEVECVMRTLESRNGNCCDSIYSEWRKRDLDWLVVINPCLPFLTVNTIKRAVNRIKKGAKLFATVFEQRGFVWDSEGKKLFKQDSISDSQNNPIFYTTCAAIHAYPREVLGTDEMVSDNIELLPVKPSLEFIDIDTQEDLELAQACALLRGKNEP